MALSPAEAAELKALEEELEPRPKKKSRGLSAAEEQELAQLEQELGPLASTGRLTAPVMAQAPEESLGRGLLRKGLKALPTVGGLVGGVAGTLAGLPTGPGAIATGVGGAALGAAGGEGWKQLGERYFFGENRSSEQAAKEIGTEALMSGGAQLAGNAVGVGGKALANTGAGKAVLGSVGRGLSKAGEALTGIPKKAIQTYAKKAPEISKMSKAAGGSAQTAGDTLRASWNKTIQETRKNLNTKISKALEKGASKEVEITPILDELGKQQELINPNLYPEQTKALDEIIRRINSLSKNGKLKLNDAQEVKTYLQEIAKPAYGSGQIFQHGKAVQKGAKSAASVARKGVAEQAPEIAEANLKLANLHNIENRMGRGLLKDGEATSSIMTAGSGANPKNVKVLERIGNATGTDMLGDAEKLYAMKAFGEAPIMPMDFTGKAAGRMALGAGAGYAADGQDGMIAGAALTSPLVLKGLVRGGRGLLNARGSLMQKGLVDQGVGQGVLQTIQMYINKRREEGATDEQIEQEIGAME